MPFKSAAVVCFSRPAVPSKRIREDSSAFTTTLESTTKDLTTRKSSSMIPTTSSTTSEASEKKGSSAVRCGVRTHAHFRVPELKSGALDHSANLTMRVLRKKSANLSMRYLGKKTSDVHLYLCNVKVACQLDDNRWQHELHRMRSLLQGRRRRGGA